MDVVGERAVVVVLLLEVRREEVAAGQIARLAADLERLRVECMQTEIEVELELELEIEGEQVHARALLRLPRCRWMRIIEYASSHSA